MFRDELKYDDRGLICGVFQDYEAEKVLMVSWLNKMVSWLNKEAVKKTWQTKRTHVFHRSRGYIMMKGEVSGNVQIVHEIYADCDHDALAY